MKNVYIAALALCVVSCWSCKKFIDEKLVANLTNDYYNTDQGLEDLVKSAYEPVRFKFQYEQAYALWNFGVDEYREGDQTNFNYYDNYDSRLNPAPSGETYLNDLWNYDYDGINRCNLGLEKIPGITGIKYLKTPVEKTQRLAELHFLRGYYYFQLVQQFGAIPIVLTSTSGIRTDFARAPVPQVYQQVIADLRFASDSLQASSSDFGRATQGAARHFLAKAYLTRGSAVTEQRGQQTTDMDSAAYYADLVINNSPYKLANNYKDLWEGVYPTHTVPALGENGQAPSGDYAKSMAAQKNSEILFSAQWNMTTALKGRFGNQAHLFYIMAYENSPTEAGMTRDLFNGRPFRRLRPTDYAMDIFDRRNDSRFYKSFVSVYYSNTSANVPKFTSADAPAPSLVGKPRFGIGDTAIYLITNTPATTLTDRDITRSRYKVYARYYRRSSDNALLQGYTAGKYLTLVKFLDPFRTSFNDALGSKDGILARLGETYLIAAEAYGRKAAPDYARALQYINALRQRAAYKAGEQKPAQHWLVEGGTPNDLNSTVAQLTATDALFTTNAASEKYPASASSTPQRFIHFILNERCRELCGELYRWEDLVRTETLIERARTFNPDAVNIQSFHKLRPIPQREIDLSTTNGAGLTADQKKAYQNPGY